MREYKKNNRIYKISYLLMSDTVDRLDTILLELRHLQRNIIYFMHEPGFNAVLRFEEDFLFGKLWEDSFPDSDADQIVNKAVADNLLLFPDPDHKKDEKKTGAITKEDEHDRKLVQQKISDNLNKRIDHLWNSDEWGIRHRRSYDSLRGTQLLKMYLVKDKIKFLFFAINHAEIKPGEKYAEKMNPAALAKFIILRDAIHQRSKQYLSRLMEYQSLFNKVLDIGVKEFPVPSLERRREIGIYMDFLNHSVRAIRKQTKHLVDHIDDRNKFKTNKKEGKPIVLHSWKHHFTSEHHFQPAHEFFAGDDKDNTSLHHITTNYWMPERFDLRPIIAHEIAHLIVQEKFDGLSDNFLQHEENSSFIQLLRSLFRVCGKYDKEFGIGEISPAHRPRALVYEIACDLLASSVKCFSYLYASLLESIGGGLHKHLLSGNLEFVTSSSNIIDLNLIHHLHGTGSHPSTMQRDWWIRLKIMIFWMKKVHHMQISGLDRILLDGVDALLDNLIFFLDEITPEEYQRGEIWISLADRLCEVIEDSDSVIDIKKWREDRSNAAKDESTNKTFPRSIKAIDENVVMCLKQIQIGLKTSVGKALHYADDCYLEKQFNESYLLDKPIENSSVNNSTEKWTEKYIYNHLYDIPWKCAITRAIDLFGNFDCDDSGVLSKNKWLKDYDTKKREVNILYILHHDNAMGRELHSLALEFYMLDSENPIDRLINALQLLVHIKPKLSSLLFDEWIREAHDILKNNKDLKGKRKYGENEKKGIKETEKKACEHGKKFVSLFDDVSFKTNNRIKQSMLQLRNYLAFHASKKKIITLLLEEMTHVHSSCKFSNKKDVRCFRMLLVSRHTAGGFYTLTDRNLDTATHMTEDSLHPVSLLTGNAYWLWPGEEKIADRKEKEKCVYPFEIFRYSNVSGRYDALSFVRVRQMRRCSLPHFEAKDRKDRNDQLTKYHFPSVLSRREFGIKIDLDFAKDCDSSKLDTPEKYKNYLAGYISIVLKRRSLRLPFLAKLLASAQGNANYDNKNKLRESIYEEKILANYLHETDTALLLDGSADLLLVLRDQHDVKKPSLRRIDAVMNLAYWLHQDFMVDRTEIILSASALDSVAEDIAAHPASQYSLECEIRCFEDRFLEYRLNEVRNKLTKNADEGKGKNKLLVTFEITAGRKDFLLRFFNKEVKNLSNLISENCWQFNGFRDGLKELLNYGTSNGQGNIQDKEKNQDGFAYIDRIEVNVNRKPPVLADELNEQPKNQ